MKAITSASPKMMRIRPMSQTALFPGLSGGNSGVEGTGELPVGIIALPLCNGVAEDSGSRADSVVSVMVPHISLPEDGGKRVCRDSALANAHSPWTCPIPPRERGAVWPFGTDSGPHQTRE